MQNKKITYLRRWWINDQIKIQLHYSVHTDVKVSTAWFIPLYRTIYIYSRWPLSSSDPTTPFPPTCAWRRSHNSLTRFTLQTKHKSQRRAFSSPTTGAKIDSSLYIYISIAFIGDVARSFRVGRPSLTCKSNWHA